MGLPRRRRDGHRTYESPPGTVSRRGSVTLGDRLSSAPCWRWRRDLNPRWACTHKRFRGVLLRPLGHATAEECTGATVVGGNQRPPEVTVSRRGHGPWRRRAGPGPARCRGPGRVGRTGPHPRPAAPRRTTRTRGTRGRRPRPGRRAGRPRGRGPSRARPPRRARPARRPRRASRPARPPSSRRTPQGRPTRRPVGPGRRGSPGASRATASTRRTRPRCHPRECPWSRPR